MYSDAQVDTAQMSLPVRLDGLGIHLVSDRDSAACDAVFLTAAALTCCAVSAGSENFDRFKGSSGVELAALWLDVYDGVLPHESATTSSKLGDQVDRCNGGRCASRFFLFSAC